jgi:hypothetical protein
MVVIGIEAGQTEWGSPPSAPVDAAVDAVVDLVLGWMVAPTAPDHPAANVAS